MAFFMVMLLVNTADSPTKANIATYFRRPGIFSQGSGTPLLMGGAGILTESFKPELREGDQGTGKADLQTEKMVPLASANPTATPTSAPTSAPYRPKPSEEEEEEEIDAEETPAQAVAAVEARRAETEAFEAVAEEIREQILGSPELQDLIGAVDVRLDANGLDIEIMDTEKTSMFSLGSSQIQPDARVAFTRLAQVLQKLPNQIEIIGHTDGKPYSSRVGGYSNWELSTDRANTARKVLEANGVAPERIVSVVGRADKELLKPADPLSASNRRISLKMKFDFNAKVDLGRDPEGLSNLDKYKKIVEERKAATRKPLPAAQPTKKHLLTPQEIIKASSKQRERKITLPKQTPASSNPPYIPKDKIFTDKPVFGPSSPFPD